MLESFKEYFNLNDFYLKISINQERISMTSFNSKLLDGATYQFSITPIEIKENKKYNNISLQDLFQKIVNSIEMGKYLINKENDCVVLSLFEGNNFDINKDIQFVFIKSNAHKTEYENGLKNMIINLRKENDLLKLDKKAESAEFLSYPGKFYTSSVKTFNNKNKSDDPNASAERPNNIFKAGSAGIQKNVTDINTAKIKSNLTSIHAEIKRKNSLELNISTLANLNYESYPSVELSKDSYDIIVGYGGNSYNGIIRKYNEDKIKIIPDYKLNKTVKKKNGEIINPHISYFAVYDGHGGNKCSNFLQENLHNYIFNSNYFPLYTMQAINAAFLQAEKSFFSIVTDTESGKLIDKSGSCAVSALIMDEWCFIINLGDSRGLYSFDSGNKLFQITRDQKPNDPIEKSRIYLAGGSIYQTKPNSLNDFMFPGEQMLERNEQKPFRIYPGGLSVSYILNYLVI